MLLLALLAAAVPLTVGGDSVFLHPLTVLMLRLQQRDRELFSEANSPSPTQKRHFVLLSCAEIKHSFEIPYSQGGERVGDFASVDREYKFRPLWEFQNPRSFAKL